MPVLEFTEIAAAHKPGGKQDTFELFARDFLDCMGYQIVSGPDRGPDQGRDLVALEIRKGVGGETSVRWLVSCKHKAHSGAAVHVDDEKDITDRVKANDCQGFLGFYSTLPSSALSSKIEGLRSSSLEVQYFDREKIEKHLLHSLRGLNIAERYFPISFRDWKRESPSSADVFPDKDSLYCECCGADLVVAKNGIISIWDRIADNQIETVDLYWCCKGHCDEVLRQRYKDKHGDEVTDRWQSIEDLLIPLFYLHVVMATLNQVTQKVVFSKEAFEKTKRLLVTTFPYVARDSTTKEREKLRVLSMTPETFGGLG